MASLSENVLVIHDQNPMTFNVWLFMMCAILLFYFIVSTVHDIKREQKLEELKKKYEEQKSDHDLDNI